MHPILQCFSDERVEAALFSQRFRTVSSQRRLVIGGAPLLPLIFGARPAVLLFVAVLIQACMSASYQLRHAAPPAAEAKLFSQQSGFVKMLLGDLGALVHVSSLAALQVGFWLAPQPVGSEDGRFVQAGTVLILALLHCLTLGPQHKALALLWIGAAHLALLLHSATGGEGPANWGASATTSTLAKELREGFISARARSPC